MKHIKLFKTQTEFDKSNTFLSIPNVSLISDTDKLIYNYEKTIAIGGGGNFSFGGQCYCSIDDLWIDEPVSNLYGRHLKTSQSFISNKKVNINIDITDNLSILNRDNTEQKLLLFNKPFLSDGNKYVIENNILTVSDFNGIVTKIEFNGLKRKDNGQRDFVGQMTSYIDNNGRPFIIENKTIDTVDAYKGNLTHFVTKDFSEYENDYLPDNKIKLFLHNIEHL